jgi:hypothetical protein
MGCEIGAVGTEGSAMQRGERHGQKNGLLEAQALKQQHRLACAA